MVRKQRGSKLPKLQKRGENSTKVLKFAWNLKEMDKSALEKITEGVLPMIREIVKEEMKKQRDTSSTDVKLELDVPFKGNFEIVLFTNRPPLMAGLRRRIDRLEASPDRFAALLVELVFAKSYVATHEFSSDAFPCAAKCAGRGENGGAGPHSIETFLALLLA